jgi:hypothetical protein
MFYANQLLQATEQWSAEFPDGIHPHSPDGRAAGRQRITNSSPAALTVKNGGAVEKQKEDQ